MIRVVSLFAGIGCADMGLYAAARELGVEVEVVDAIDSWPEAVEIYNRNLPHPVARVADVKQLDVSDLPPHDLVIGGPPCQPFSLAGKRQGHDDPRNCLPDFLRLAASSSWLMENVVPRLVNAPFAVKLNAFDFGDVTTRKRWFYSSHLLHVIPTPGPRRFGDIRDHEADRIAAERRMLKQGTTYADADALSSLTAHAWHGHDVRSNVKMVAMRPYPKPFTEIPEDGALGSVTSHTHHQPLVVTHRPREGGSRNGKYVAPVEDDNLFQSLTADAAHAYAADELPAGTRILKVGLRGHSASAFEDDEPIGSLVSNSWHGNEISRLGPSVRCPSLLEMARAHSIPDDFDWAGATKTARGKMIANGWPIGMATAVCRAMLVALGAGRAAA